MICFLLFTSASSRALWASNFSCSPCFFDFSSSWMVLPVSPNCSVSSIISSETKKKCDTFCTI